MRSILKSLCVSTAVLSLYACADNSDENAEPQMKISMVTTHAFDTDMQVQSLSYVPNNVAPWLGRVILMGTDGKIFSTDIEGRSPIAIDTNTYRDTLGLSRDNAPGVFLAVTEDNKLVSFVESDDDGSFTPITVTAPLLAPLVFCQSTEPAKNSLKLLMTANKIVSLSVEVKDDLVEILSQDSQSIPKNTIACVFSGDTLTVLIQNAKSQSAVKTLIDGKWKTIANTNNSIHINAIDFAEDSYIAISGNGHQSLQKMTPHTSAPNTSLSYTINDGLSIQGMDKTDYVHATSANFGGAAFSDGVIAMIDSAKNRIVFISRIYASEKINEVDTRK
ncbi:MAG: hypothetical protein COA43_03595 [Robiginitomaculum sp.]|nr:MAG: hypothetical protein COA43_03595 [Robiginitomaculum sp.]